LQHLESEGLRWERACVIGRCARCAGRCVRRVGRRDGDANTCSGSGKRSGAVFRVKTRLAPQACRPRLAPVGSVRVVGCRHMRSLCCRVVTCRSLSEKRSRSLAPKVVGCARSRAASVVIRERSRGSYAATRRREAGTWSIGRRPRSGTRIAARDGQKRRSSRRTLRCATTCRTASPV